MYEKQEKKMDTTLQYLFLCYVHYSKNLTVRLVFTILFWNFIGGEDSNLVNPHKYASGTD